ncbi:MAG: RNA 2',3'-cyclic phosphodiesterase [Planctomycetota bacterium]|nr:RNA 2',3'-cyclic phosphodiesterase [Planctomycetota bacterium]
MSMIRTFIGVEIDADVREALAAAMRRLRSAAPAAKWVRVENLHLTFKFLGEVSPADLEQVFAAARQAAAEFASFELEISGLGCFPNERYPRVVWAGCGEGRAQAAALAQRLEDSFAALGYERERRPFSPHLTLARLRDPRDGRDLAAALAAEGEPHFGCTSAEEIVVFMSELRKTGPVYSPMCRIPLAT